MIAFHPVTIQDRQKIRRILAQTDRKSCEESFANLFTWGREYGYEVAYLGDSFILRVDGMYSLPIGKDVKQQLPKAKELYGDGKFTLISLEAKDFSLLERHFRHIRGRYDRRYSDYVYSSEKLRLLTGRKLAAKRNHINAFEREHKEWHTEKITADNLSEVVVFHQKWCDTQTKDESLSEEITFTDKMLAHYFELKLDGLVLYADGEIVAYSLGEPISSDTYCVHVEKALASVRGAYPMINREFARAFCEKYRYINREDDSGDSGLRRAKLSYEPCLIVHKYQAEMEI